MLQIPDSPADITPDWLSHVLDAPVAEVHVEGGHEGTTGRLLIRVDYAAPCGLPARLFVKLPPSDETQRAFVCANGMGRREAMFYRHLSSQVPVRVPRCYHADWDDTGEHYVILLERLEDGGCTFRNASTRYSLDYVRSVLSAFARLHAAFWESPRFDDDLAWIRPPGQDPVALTLIGRALDQHRHDMPRIFSRLAELYLSRADAIHRLWEEGPQTLVHGDVHDGNLFLDGDEPGFLDWAVTARATPLRDVGYFLAGTLRVADQQRHREAMLSYYRDQLLANRAPAPALDDMYRQYQWHAAYVWVGAAATLAMGDAWQPVNYVKRSLEHLHAALDELETVPALEAALGEGT
jgi:aminoglycoside phosphotransferase (APT) family kinase protein